MGNVRSEYIDDLQYSFQLVKEWKFFSLSLENLKRIYRAIGFQMR